MRIDEQHPQVSQPRRRWLARLTLLAFVLVIIMAAVFFAQWRLQFVKRNRLLVSESRMSQLCYGLRIFYDDDENRPLTATTGAEPTTSWRVKWLAILDERPLWEQYDHSQAWDAPENQYLLPKCPRFFSHEPLAGQSEILLVSGDFDQSPREQGAFFLSIDAAIFEVPWTRPYDITFAELHSRLQDLLRKKSIHRADSVLIATPVSGAAEYRKITVDELLQLAEGRLANIATDRVHDDRPMPSN